MKSLDRCSLRNCNRKCYKYYRWLNPENLEDLGDFVEGRCLKHIVIRDSIHLIEGVLVISKTEYQLYLLNE